MNIRLLTTLSALILATAIAGCNAYPTVERDFGNSVRHMVQSQQVTSGPVSLEPVEGGDGDRLNAAFEVYRSDVSRPEQPGQSVSIDIGSALSQ